MCSLTSWTPVAEGPAAPGRGTRVVGALVPRPVRRARRAASRPPRRRCRPAPARRSPGARSGRPLRRSRLFLLLEPEPYLQRAVLDPGAATVCRASAAGSASRRRYEPTVTTSSSPCGRGRRPASARTAARSAARRRSVRVMVMGPSPVGYGERVGPVVRRLGEAGERLGPDRLAGLVRREPDRQVGEGLARPRRAPRAARRPSPRATRPRRRPGRPGSRSRRRPGSRRATAWSATGGPRRPRPSRGSAPGARWRPSR